MIDLITLRDILRIVAWAFFGTLPLLFAQGAGSADKIDAKDGLMLLAFFFQLILGIGAFVAGAK